MRRIIIILTSIILVSVSCNKKDVTLDNLSGKWVMVKLHDKQENKTYVKPTGLPDAYLEISNNNFTGSTGVNAFRFGILKLEGKEITFESLIFDTYTMENEWSTRFVWVLMACQFQALYPCKPSIVEFVSRKEIRVTTPLRYGFTLKKQ